MPLKFPVPITAAFAIALLAGCENAPPGAGFTNGPPPSALGAEDKGAIRTDLQEPTATGGDAAVAASAVPASGPAPAAPAVAPQATTPKPSGTGGEPGAAKPSADAKPETPRSPQ
ncbi:MAG: hypothetical protein P4L84_11480 [Isosphaeraceae bacterium]|nr:hypothetical protein [Isosphaeraceae bacterium]